MERIFEENDVILVLCGYKYVWMMYVFVVWWFMYIDLKLWYWFVFDGV